MLGQYLSAEVVVGILVEGHPSALNDGDYNLEVKVCSYRIVVTVG